jgi:hypothetical protein
MRRTPKPEQRSHVNTRARSRANTGRQALRQASRQALTHPRSRTSNMHNQRSPVLPEGTRAGHPRGAASQCAPLERAPEYPLANNSPRYDAGGTRPQPPRSCSAVALRRAPAAVCVCVWASECSREREREGGRESESKTMREGGRERESTRESKRERARACVRAVCVCGCVAFGMNVSRLQIRFAGTARVLVL